MFANGEFGPLLAWLVEHVHQHGRRFEARELIERATGKAPTVQPLLDHLARKAQHFYGV